MGQKWTTFTLKHLRLCVERKIRGCARELWQWVIQRLGHGEVEFDLKKFNRWIELRRGKPYDPKTLKDAVIKLHESGLIQDMGLEPDGSNRYKWNWRRWLVKPIEVFNKPVPKSPSGNSPKPEQNPEKDPSNPQYKKDSFIQQQQLSLDPLYPQRILALCKTYGLRFQIDGNAFKEVVTYTENQIGLALEYVRNVGTRKQIETREGYFIEALRGGWGMRESFGVEPTFIPPEYVYVYVEEDSS
jgi:hypothetical protein